MERARKRNIVVSLTSVHRPRGGGRSVPSMGRKDRRRTNRRVIGGSGSAWVLSSGGTQANLDIDFVNDRAWNGSIVSIPSLLTCTRASIGYYTKADGTLQSFSNNVLRYGTNGLLVEEARTNLCIRSQTLDHADWTKAGTTVTADQIAAPDGTTTADQIFETAGGGNIRHIIARQSAVIASSTNTYSIYVKKGTRRYVQLLIVSTHGFDCYFDFDTGTITDTNVVGSGALTSSSVETLANGWFRLILTGVCSSDTTPFLHIALSDRPDNTTGVFQNNSPAYAGSISEYVYAWGAQVEAGAFATSYIPTTASTATRAADAVSMTVASISGFSATAGTAYEQATSINLSNNGGVWTFDNGTSDERLQRWRFGTSSVKTVSDGGVNILNDTGGTLANGATYKHAWAFASGDFAWSLDGGVVGTSVAVGFPTVTTLRFGVDSVGSTIWNSYIKRFAYWNTRLNNAALQALTT